VKNQIKIFHFGFRESSARSLNPLKPSEPGKNPRSGRFIESIESIETVLGHEETRPLPRPGFIESFIESF
jgi:hypothetical protein